MDKNTKKEIQTILSKDDVKLGTNSALIPDAWKNYVPKIYIHKDFFNIYFDIDDLDKINGNAGWCPAEGDKEFMSQNAFDEALIAYNKKKEELLFTNTFVHYESCDCGSGYPCGHPSYPTEIEVVDGKTGVHHVITIDGDDSLIFAYEVTKSEIQIMGLSKFTYGDFIKFCKFCDITLESKYDLTLRK